MSQDIDLDSAVAAGIIGEDQALALRALEARRTGISTASAEQFDVPSGLADIMTALGIMACGTAAIAFLAIAPPLAVPVLGLIIWAGRRFTIERRMAASAFAIFFLFCVALALAALMIGFGTAHLATGTSTLSPLQEPLGLLLVGAIVTAGCTAWWYWTRLPVAVAAAWVAALNLVTNAVRLLVPDAPSSWSTGFHLGWGLVMLAVALWWDLTDIRRETIRSRVAFWCHAAAGFFIARAVLILVAGRADETTGWMSLYVARAAELDPAGAPAFLAFFLVCLAVALVIDRRSLIFATLYQAWIALLLVTGHFAAALLIVGALLIGLARGWQRLRRTLLARLPLALAAQLPRTDLVDPGQRPTRRHLAMAPRRWQPMNRNAA